MLNLGKLDLKKKRSRSKVSTTDQYVDAKGRRRYKGNKNLKNTQKLSSKEKPCALTLDPNHSPPSRTYTPAYASRILSIRRRLLSALPLLKAAAGRHVLLLDCVGLQEGLEVSGMRGYDYSGR